MMAYVTSNTFSIRVNKTEVTQIPLNTQVIIYKGTNQLSAVSGTPGTNEYKVSITGTANCSARLENDYKTITLTSVSSNNGQINISINVENVKTYTKTISVANITATSSLKNVSNRVSTVEQTTDSLTTEVSKKLNSEDLSSRIQQSPTDIKIGFNKITDFITIDPNNGLKVNHTDGSYTRISPGGLELYQASTGYRYKSLIATGSFSIKGRGTAVVTLPAQFDDVQDYEIEIFYMIETSWAGTSSMVDKTCICEMYVNDLYHTYMEKDSNGHWTQKVDYSLRDMCVVDGLNMNVGDFGDMSGYVQWIAFA